MSAQKRPRDLNQLAASIVASATTEEDETELETCPDCKGAGTIELEDWRDGQLSGMVEVGCRPCKGTGRRVIEAEESPLVSRARKGGLKGGKARAEKLSPERRREIAQKAARSRWGDSS